MKTMIVFLVLMFANLAFAANNVSTSVETPALTSALANINQGNMQVGGGFSWSQTRQAGQRTSSSYAIYPSLEYFVVDHFSVGGTLSYSGFNSDGGSDYTGTGIGPSASLYFFNQEKLAVYAAQLVSFTKYSDEDETRTRGTTSLGVKYFTTPAVAFGVALAAAYDLGEETRRNTKTDTTSLGGNFSFYY